MLVCINSPDKESNDNRSRLTTLNKKTKRLCLICSDCVCACACEVTMVTSTEVPSPDRYSHGLAWLMALAHLRVCQACCNESIAAMLLLCSFGICC
jgi:hypothetical protein